MRLVKRIWNPKNPLWRAFRGGAALGIIVLVPFAAKSNQQARTEAQSDRCESSHCLFDNRLTVDVNKQAPLREDLWACFPGVEPLRIDGSGEAIPVLDVSRPVNSLLPEALSLASELQGSPSN